MSIAATFDVSRAVLEDYGKDFTAPQLIVERVQPLTSALEAGQLTPDTRLLTFEVDGRLYTFPMSIVLTYNVIQGKIADDQPWVMTFCNACNTGMVFDPRLNGQLLHFQRRGAYDGLMLIYDEETQSYWQHITGESVHGSSKGAKLKSITTTRPMTASEAAKHSQSVWLPVHELTSREKAFSSQMEKMRAEPQRLETVIASTIGVQEDTRRPRFELGLGIWDGDHSLFVPVETLNKYNNVALRTLGGRGLLIYLESDALSPVAVFSDSKSARWNGNTLRLDDGYIKDGRFYPAQEGQAPKTLERPQQLLMRWFGFSVMHPTCAILEDKPKAN